MRIAEFNELRKLLIAQDIALIVIAVAVVIGMVALLIAAGERHRP